MSTLKMKRMEELLKAAGAWLEPNEYYPDPLQDLDEEKFQLYVEEIKRKKNRNEELFKNLSLLHRALPAMEEKAGQLKEEFSYLQNRLKKIYEGGE